MGDTCRVILRSDSRIESCNPASRVGGAIVASGNLAAWQTGGRQIVGCTNLLALTLTVPSAGTVVLTSTVHVWLEHGATTDTWVIRHGDTTTDCADNHADRASFFQEIPDTWPTDAFMNLAGTLVNAFPVSGAGTYTYYVNVQMFSGQSAADRVSEASAAAIWYPA